jgi:hypothetical protein
MTAFSAFLQSSKFVPILGSGLYSESSEICLPGLGCQRGILGQTGKGGAGSRRHKVRSLKVFYIEKDQRGSFTQKIA